MAEAHIPYSEDNFWSALRQWLSCAPPDEHWEIVVLPMENQRGVTIELARYGNFGKVYCFQPYPNAEQQQHLTLLREQAARVVGIVEERVRREGQSA